MQKKISFSILSLKWRSSKSPRLMGKWALSLWVISLLLLCSGCVDRFLVVRTEPVGAKVFVDGIDVGISPVRIPFNFYGTRDLLVRMEEDEKRGERSLAPQRRIVKLTPP